MKLPIHVCIVEDDPEIRQTLALIINGTTGFYCHHTFNDCETALQKLPELAPNVVLMDIELPGMTGIQGIRKMKPNLPDTDFLMLTIKQDEASIFKALCAGASGYLLKDTAPSVILQSIEEVYKGGAPMSGSIARKVISSFRQSIASPLSPRETEILQLLCDGLNYISIADQLFLSTHTVKSHIKNIYKKLHVHSRGEAVSKAIKDKLI